jgi:predicted nucleic acid-binding protein
VDLSCVLADTGYWVDLLRARGTLSGAARRWRQHLRERGARVVTLDWALAELVALATVREGVDRPKLIRFVDRLQSVPDVEVVHVTAALRDDAWALLAVNPDRDWSWTDACAFVLMRQRRVAGALAWDEHFRQAGYTPLLQLDPRSFE